MSPCDSFEIKFLAATVVNAVCHASRENGVRPIRVYQRKDSKTRWWISYTHAGKQRREPAGAAKQQAKALFAKRQAELFEGAHFPEKRRGMITLNALKDLWLKEAQKKKSIAADRQRFEGIVGHFGPDVAIACIKRGDVEGFRAALVGTVTRRGKKTAPATVNRYLVLLQSAFNLAVQHQYLSRNPVTGIKKLRENNKRDRHCSAEEYAKLVGAAAGDLRLEIVLAYHTAMRSGEIANLTWDDADTRSSCPMVKLRDGATKTGAGREVPLTREAAAELAAYLRNLSGRVMSLKASSFSPAFAKLCKSVGIKALRLHDFRHTAATNLRRAGVDPFTIAAIPGHKSLAMLQRYNTITIEDKQKAVTQLASRDS